MDKVMQDLTLAFLNHPGGMKVFVTTILKASKMSTHTILQEDLQGMSTILGCLPNYGRVKRFSELGISGPVKSFATFDSPVDTVRHETLF